MLSPATFIVEGDKYLSCFATVISILSKRFGYSSSIKEKCGVQYHQFVFDSIEILLYETTYSPAIIGKGDNFLIGITAWLLNYLFYNPEHRLFYRL